MTTGTVYLLHFDPGLPVTGNRVARHYLGFDRDDVEARVAQQAAGSPAGRAAPVAGRAPRCRDQSAGRWKSPPHMAHTPRSPLRAERWAARKLSTCLNARS